MPTLPLRAAAYTRTGVLSRFLDLLSESQPNRVDAQYAETRLGLKGGDVRAFLQSVRVLGLIDPYGAITERGRRTRSASQRPGALREALEEAYPELVARWAARGGMHRKEVEDFFKLEYGLSASSAGPAAKLFSDLMASFGESELTDDAWDIPLQRPATSRQNGSRRSEPEPSEGRGRGRETVSSVQKSASTNDLRLAALETVRSSLRIDMSGDWDEERMRLAFDRMEQLIDRILNSPGNQG
jgi:hypothetical protein